MQVHGYAASSVVPYLRGAVEPAVSRVHATTLSAFELGIVGRLPTRSTDVVKGTAEATEYKLIFEGVLVQVCWGCGGRGWRCLLGFVRTHVRFVAYNKNPNSNTHAVVDAVVFEGPGVRTCRSFALRGHAKCRVDVPPWLP